MCKLIDDHDYKPKGKFTLVCKNCGKETVNEEAINTLISLMEARIASLESQLGKQSAPHIPVTGTGSPWDINGGGYYGGGGSTIGSATAKDAGGGGCGGVTTIGSTTDIAGDYVTANYSDGSSKDFSREDVSDGVKTYKKEFASLKKR